MKTHFIFRLFTVLIVGLMLSMPLNTLAQQNTETAPVSLAAKIAAEQDANSDFNNRSWIGIGAGVAAIGCVATLAGYGIGSALSPDTPSALDFMISLPRDEEMIGCCVGFTVGTLVPFIGIYSYPAHPPAERLVGKSTEYVEHYTAAYSKRTRYLRTRSAMVGCGATGGGVMLLGGLLSNLFPDSP